MMNTHLLILFISNVTREAPKFWLPVYEWQLKFCNNHNIDWQLVLIVCVRVWTHLNNQTAKRGPERTLPALPLHHAAGCSPHETIDAVHHDIQVCSALKNKQNVKKTHTHSCLVSWLIKPTHTDTHLSLCWYLLVAIRSKTPWLLHAVHLLAPSSPLSFYLYPRHHHHQQDTGSAIEGR